MLTLSEILEYDNKIINLLGDISFEFNKKEDKNTNKATILKVNDSELVVLENNLHFYSVVLKVYNGMSETPWYMVKNTDDYDTFRGIKPFINEYGIFCTANDYDVLYDEYDQFGTVHNVLTEEQYACIESTAFQLSTEFDLQVVRALSMQTNLYYNKRHYQIMCNTKIQDHLYNPKLILNLEKYLETL